MKKIACYYAIVRFMPFTETGEFANIGIVALAPQQQYFGYKLLPHNKTGRVTKFFDQLEKAAIQHTLRMLQQELQRITDTFQEHYYHANNNSAAIELFTELTKPREAMLQYSTAGLRLTTNAEKELETLYSYYVERAFVTKQTGEQAMEKALRQVLKTAHLNQAFKRGKLGNEQFEVPVPFLQKQQQQVQRVIKPLNLTQAKPTDVLEHGAQWQFRLKKLTEIKQMPPQMLFTYQAPVAANSKAANIQASCEVLQMLEQQAVTLIPNNDHEGIIQFASAAIH